MSTMIPAKSWTASVTGASAIRSRLHDTEAHHVLKLGYKASAEQFSGNQLLDFTCQAEAAGFDSVFLSDHFQPWRHTNGHAPYSLALMGAMGAKTTRIKIGTSVLTPTFRYHPSIVAQAFGTMGTMFPGRIILGIGTGEGLNEVPAMGMEWPPMKERFARFRESVRLIKQLWSEDRVTFDGDYYKTESATIYDRPDTPVPIYRCRRRPDGRQVCRSRRQWLHLHQRQAGRTLSRKTTPRRRSRPRNQ